MLSSEYGKAIETAASFIFPTFVVVVMTTAAIIMASLQKRDLSGDRTFKDWAYRFVFTAVVVGVWLLIFTIMRDTQ